MSYTSLSPSSAARVRAMAWSRSPHTTYSFITLCDLLYCDQFFYSNCNHTQKNVQSFCSKIPSVTDFCSGRHPYTRQDRCPAGNDATLTVYRKASFFRRLWTTTSTTTGTYSYIITMLLMMTAPLFVVCESTSTYFVTPSTVHDYNTVKRFQTCPPRVTLPLLYTKQRDGFFSSKVGDVCGAKMRQKIPQSL